MKPRVLPKTQRRLSVVMAIVAASASPSDVRAAPCFQGLGQLPGAAYNYASAVSADGTTVVGLSDSIDGVQAFFWIHATGIQGLTAAGFDGSIARAVNGDGSMIVGSGVRDDPDSPEEALKWTSTGQIDHLGDLPGGKFFSYASGVTPDGSIIIGQSESAAGYEACRWIANGEIESLGVFGPTEGVSADGLVIIGTSNDGVNVEAWKWTEADGLQGLGDLPGGPFYSSPRGINGDGSVIVGAGISELSDGYEAFRWTEADGIQSLGDLPGGLYSSFAWDVDASGSVIVGNGTSASGTEATIWTELGGIRSLAEFLLNEHGIDTSDWELVIAYGISADGTVIVGSGRNPSGQTEGFMVRLDGGCVPPPLPCSGDVSGDERTTVQDFTIMSAWYGFAVTAGTNGDLNGDGIVNVADFVILAGNFGCGG